MLFCKVRIPWFHNENLSWSCDFPRVSHDFQEKKLPTGVVLEHSTAASLEPGGQQDAVGIPCLSKWCKAKRFTGWNLVCLFNIIGEITVWYVVVQVFNMINGCYAMLHIWMTVNPWFLCDIQVCWPPKWLQHILWNPECFPFMCTSRRFWTSPSFCHI